MIPQSPLVSYRDSSLAVSLHDDKVEDKMKANNKSAGQLHAEHFEQSAFPQNVLMSHSHEQWITYGLSKRELFAAMAMQGKLSGCASYNSWMDFAQDCVAMSDALIAELAKDTSK